MRDKIIGYISLITAMLGSAMIALNLGVTQFAYMFFIVSACTSIYLLKKAKAEPTLVFTQYYFVCVNIVGMFRYFGS